MRGSDLGWNRPVVTSAPRPITVRGPCVKKGGCLGHDGKIVCMTATDLNGVSESLAQCETRSCHLDHPFVSTAVLFIEPMSAVIPVE